MSNQAGFLMAKLSMMRVFYTLLFYLAYPALVLRLLWRGRKNPDYHQRIAERFAIYPAHRNCPGVFWFHAVSVGEAEALFPLIRELQARHPNAKWLITTTTPTGSARVRSVLKETVSHVYLPYDVPDAIERFMRCFKPQLAVFMETEIWPNIYAYCGQHAISLYIINARLSEKSARGYRKIPSLIQPALANITAIAAQTADDQNRFIEIGANPQHIVTLGNIKFDVNLSQEHLEQGQRLKQAIFRGRFVWICASTHPEEEAICLTLYQQLKQAIPELLLLIAPRHPERFLTVQKLAEQRGFVTITRSSNLACLTTTDVYLADTLGDLKMLYTTADIALVGGSLVPIGGHNILEAAVAGVPILFGPYMNNFKLIAQNILAEQAAIQCLDDKALANAVLMLYQSPEQRLAMVQKAKAFIIQNQGVMLKTCALLETSLLASSPT